MKKIMITIGAILVATAGYFTYNQFTKPKTADVFKTGITGIIEGYNPIQGTTADTSQVVAQINDTLYSVDGDTVLPSGAAGEPEVSSDKLTYKIKLKENNWVDYTGAKKGKVTAQDYEYSFKALADPKNKSQYATFLAEGNIKNAIEVAEGKVSVDELGVKALDDKTLEIKLTAPTPYLTDYLAYNKLAPMSVQNVKEKGGLDAAFKTYKDVWYSGAYYMAEEKENESYKMTRNEHFSDSANVNVKNLLVKVIKDPETRYKEFQSGNLDQASLTKKEDVQAKKNNKNVIYKREGSTFYLALNQTSKSISNINVRKVIQYGVDYTKITEETLGTGALGAYTYTPKGLTQGVYKKEYTDILGKSRDLDLNKAKQAAEKAKAELNGNVDVKFVAAESGGNKLMLEAIQAELKQNFGFNVILEYIPGKEYFAKIKRDPSSYDVMVAGWSGDYADPGTFLSTLVPKNPDLNYSRNNDDELAKLIEDAQAEGDADKRMEKMAKAEKYAVEEKAYVVPMRQSAGYIETNGKYDYKTNTLKVQLYRYLKVK